MKALAVFLLATPAMADNLPYQVGDYVVQSQLKDSNSNKVYPNPLPKSEWACFRVETISANDIWLRLESGYLDMRNPGETLPPEYAAPAQAPIGTGTGYSASEGIFTPCVPPDPTGYTTVNTTCDIARLYVRVPDCKGRPLPPP